MILQIILAAFASGMLSAMGFGSGAILVIWLTSQMNYSQLQAQGVNLMFFIPCAAISLILLARKGFVNIREALPLGLGGAIGLIVGHLVLPLIPSELLSKLFGVFVILLSVQQLFKIRKTKSGQP